ncbi:MAG: Rpn family recombination-promoting nuclease/putative transposase [Eubacterium sp.]|nr:Rpn family recombination-promoting nuclease/putative transposase [Eubacterium sp.]
MSEIIHISKEEQEKKWNELKLSDNFIFQKFMMNPENCKKVLSEILGVEVTKVEYPVYERVVDIRPDAKSIRLDVYAEGDNTIYNVEMQCSDTEHLPKRSRYYQDLIDLDLMEKGAHYSELNRSFVIFVCTFDYYGKGNYKYTFTNRCKEIGDLEFGDETTKIIVNTKGSKGEVSKDFRDFINAVNGEFDKSGYSATIKSELERIKNNNRWRREYMTLYLHEKQMMWKSLQEGLAKGRAKGLEEGLAEGKAKGLLEAERTAVKRMLTKLSVEEIVELGYEKQFVMSIAKDKDKN